MQKKILLQEHTSLYQASREKGKMNDQRFSSILPSFRWYESEFKAAHPRGGALQSIWIALLKTVPIFISYIYSGHSRRFQSSLLIAAISTYSSSPLKQDLHLLLLPFETRSPPRSYSSTVVFAFVRAACSPSRGSYFSFITECAKWKTNDVGFPNFSTTTVQLSSDIRIDGRFWCEVLQMEWNCVLVNVQLKGTGTESGLRDSANN
ncbi:hypothetical protein AVEN_272290-1 [Araneus ventricosus]|uniref:Uncharacterized protein n=1 Tax=Araneus ventricosus TaxID=182803 RepID=A0A4Y2PH48_ARAVE|nr:hypothetical protein AVEN_272290-1 [Araneus ventricosus]